MSYVFKKSGESYVLDQKAEIHATLPSDVYKIANVPNVGIVFQPLKIVKDDLIKVENSITNDIVNFISNFKSEETKARYAQTKVIHKTGILLHGPAGSGKSGTINLIIDELIKDNAIIFFDAEPELVAAVLPAVREQNPDKLIGVVYEEFDEWLQHEQATINSFLDGQLSVNNMIVLATTNYIAKIPSRIKNRPSRFQLVHEIGVPSREFREAWFTKKLADVGHSDKLASFVDQSDGMVVDQMKDLIVSHIALQIPLPEVVQKLQKMSEEGVGIDDYVEHEQYNTLRASDIRKMLGLPKGISLKKPDNNPFGK